MIVQNKFHGVEKCTYFTIWNIFNGSFLLAESVFPKKKGFKKII